jgi:hypothetical protein
MSVDWQETAAAAAFSVLLALTYSMQPARSWCSFLEGFFNRVAVLASKCRGQAVLDALSWQPPHSMQQVRTCTVCVHVHEWGCWPSVAEVAITSQ